jgi:hypothetical protein
MINGITSQMATYSPRQEKSYGISESSPKDITRNVAYKSEIVGYAKDLARNIVGFKDIAKSLSANSESIRIAAHTEGMSSAIEWLKEDISAFTDEFNETNGFAKNQSHSRMVSNLADDVTFSFMEQTDAMQSVGLSLSKEGKLSFDSTKIEDLDFNQLNNALEEVNKIADSVYGKMAEFLEKPLASHMQFKSFNYYYNYKMGAFQQNPFQLVAAGAVVDLAI